MKKVRVRFAPSPTGLLHLGGLRTALYDYVYAKKHKGDFILRIEDTDRNRFVEGAIENLISSLQSMGIDFNEGPEKDNGYGPYIQSERLELYRKYADQLVESGKAYYCFCSKERLDQIREEQAAKKLPIQYDGFCKKLTKEEVQQKIANGEEYVIRLNMPKDDLFTFNDVIRGEVQIDSSQVDDQVIIKSDGFPTYHLAAIVDDHLMEISHVLRGEEWLPSTPKHIFIYESLGWDQPEWVHLPLILNTDKSKLSKRHGDFSVEAFVQQGYLKEALVNFVALLGWHPQTDDEIFDLDKMIEEFSFERVNKAGAVFDKTKLDWMNGLYIRKLDLSHIVDLAKPFFKEAGVDISDSTKFEHVVSCTREYINTLKEAPEFAQKFYSDPVFTESAAELMKNEDTKTICSYMITKLEALETIDAPEAKSMLKRASKDLKIKGKHFFMPVRAALIGEEHGPDIPLIIEILGIEECKKRFSNALNM